jgi:sigma-B regulation protein RsbU (phosphoserine phosphatase)
MLFYKLVEEKEQLGGGGNLDIGVVIDDITKEFEQLQMYKELEIARTVQEKFLPRSNFTCDGIETYGVTYPAKEVGGDYYDCILHDNRLHFAIADVSGKGISAAMVMSCLKTTLQNLIETGTQFHKIMPYLNSIIYKNTPENMFVTMFLGRIDLVTRELHYCNTGHYYPIHVQAGGTIDFLKTGGSVLGAFAESSYDTGKDQLHVDDTIFCYTDGIIDAENGRGVQFDEDRVIDTFKTMVHLPPDKLVRGIIDEVQEFQGIAPQVDDITVFALRMVK